MVLFGIGMSLVALGGLFIITDNAHCRPPVDEPVRLTRYKDVPDATNFLYESMSSDMPMEEKCKRYAVLLILASGSVTYQTTVTHLSVLSEDILDKHLKKTDIARLSALFMKAIDKYRASQLDPAFLDLIHCLRQIDTPEVKAYMEEPELIVLENLYRQLLNKPDIKLDLGILQLSEYPSSFRTSLGILFAGHLKDESVLVEDESRDKKLPETADIDGGPRLQEMTPQPPVGDPSQPAGGLGPGELKLLKLRRRRLRERERVFKLQNVEAHRVRERERLRQRRLRILQPIELRVRERVRQQRRRNRLRANIELRVGKDFKDIDLPGSDQLLQQGLIFEADPPPTKQTIIDFAGQRWYEAASVPRATFVPANIVESTPHTDIPPHVSQFHSQSLMNDLIRPMVLNTSSSIIDHQQRQQSKVPERQQPATSPEYIFPIMPSSAPPEQRPQARQTLFKPRPLVRPITDIPQSAANLDSLKDDESAALPQRAIFSFDQILNLRSDPIGLIRPNTGDYSAPRHVDHNHLSQVASMNENRSMGGLAAARSTIDPHMRADWASYNRLASPAGHPNTRVQSTSDRDPRTAGPPPPVRNASIDTDSRLASLWYDFDRRHH